jgi:endonuclease/exonuclease/phosphatase family metal-dependent hydrolase
LEWRFFLELRPTNGALIENERGHLHSHKQIPCPFNQCQRHFLESKAQLITLQIPGNENVTIINVYDACSSNERATMWKRLNETILAADHFILGGDFNHWEEIECEGVVGKC